jgi:hypothetical protein
VGLPHLAALLPFEVVDNKNDPITGDPSIAKHFERIEAVVVKQGTISVGVLPAGTSRAAAECSLEATAKCAPKTHLKTGAAVKHTAASGGDRFAKLVEMKVTGETSPRFVVLVATQEDAIAAGVTSRTTSALHVDFETRPFTRLIGNVLPLPTRITGDVSVDGSDIVMKLVGM